MNPLLSRRQALQTALATSVALATGNATSRDRKVIVVGAGLAGLNAALTLERWGYRVEVLEAKDRVGGRLWTLDHISGSPEAGGNVIGANYGRVLHMAHDLNLPLRVPPRTLPSDYCVGGKRIARGDWATSPANPLPSGWQSTPPERLLGKLNASNPLLTTRAWHDTRLMAMDQPADKGLKSLGFPDAAIGLVNANNSYGNHLSDTSLMTLYRVLAELGRLSGPALTVTEVATGNMRLAEAMAARLSQPISTRDPVVEVRQSSEGVQLTLSSGHVADGEAAIMALPVPALRAIQIDLPTPRRAALNAVRYHKVVQLHCVIDEPYWRNSGWQGSWWTDGPLGRIFMRPAPDSEHHNMTIWINGDNCDPLNALDDEACTQRILKALWKLIPDARAVTSVGQLVRWTTDPFAGGTWALWQPGQAGRHHDVIRAPIGKVAFAGEHTAEAYRGMEAAMESGERAALEVMRILA